MVAWSKLSPELETLPCQSLAHPWTNSCLQAAAFTFSNSFVGSTVFFALLNLGQYASTILKNKKKVSVKDFLLKQLRSTLFASVMTTGTFVTHCLIRHLLGRYYYYTLLLIPGSIAGFACFLESRRGRELYVNAFANCALEFLFRQLEYSKVLKWSPNTQTFIFMIISSILSSLFNWTSFDLNYFWFFIPPKVNENSENKVCFHNEDCKKKIFNLFLMYSTTGLVLQVLRLFLGNLKTPKLFLTSLSRTKTYKLATFLGCYAVIYQMIRCFFYQRERKYSVKHDAIAGFLAGAAFRFQPTVPILNSAIITTIQILGEAAFRRKMLPNVPYLEMVFSLLYGLMIHARILCSEQCPQVMIYITSTVTHGMSDNCTQNYKSVLRSLGLSKT